jgi:hypothetical protein
MASRTSLKKNKRTKHGRTRRQRHRRRQMRGGDFLDFFKPTKKDEAYCQKQFDECKANIKPESDSTADADSGSSDFFKTPTFISTLFESKDSTGSGEEEKENEGIELQEYPGSEQQAAPLDATALNAAPASDATALNAAAAAPPLAAPVSYADAAAAASPLSPPVESTLDSTAIDAAKLSPPPAPAEYGLTAQPTAESEETEAEKAARINNSMGMVGVVSGGGSRKKYKKRNANRSKKNKNRRNNKRTNKRN